MTRAAKKALDVSGEQAKRQAQVEIVRRRKVAKDAFAGKAFEDLHPQEKDALLKELAIRSGLLAE